jgi:hypothetical protein
MSWIRKARCPSALSVGRWASTRWGSGMTFDMDSLRPKQLPTKKNSNIEFRFRALVLLGDLRRRRCKSGPTELSATQTAAWPWVRAGVACAAPSTTPLASPRWGDRFQKAKQSRIPAPPMRKKKSPAEARLEFRHAAQGLSSSAPKQIRERGRWFPSVSTQEKAPPKRGLSARRE